MPGARFATQRDVQDYLNAHTDYEKQSAKYSPETYSLARMEGFVAALGHPERRFQSVHVAGSKGKGSVSYHLARVLQAQGMKTGLYTSPHLLDLRERIQIDGEWISEAELVAVFNYMLPVMEARMEAGSPLTFFDMITAAAFQYFAECNVDCAVLEVGLGGRLDSTNVVTPRLSVITSIQLEHTDKLGATLPLIAGEKGGIIKPEVPLLHGPVSREVEQVFQALCEKRNSERISLETLAVPEVAKNSESEIRKINLSLAWHAARLVLGEKFDARLAAEALSTSFVPGRQQWIDGSPSLVLDCAHTPDSLTELCDHLRKRLGDRKLVLLATFLSDKNTAEALRILAALNAPIVLTTVDSPRASALDDLFAQAGGKFPQVETDSNPLAALQKAKTLAGPAGVVCVTGSTYLVGEILRNM